MEQNIWKGIDPKEEQIATLKSLLEKSSSEKQKKLISRDLKMLENGYIAEKENAYYLDFCFKGNGKFILLHDIRLLHGEKSAQIDHILINHLGITVLESKSFKGTLTITDDGSLNVKYGRFTKTFPNPIEQNRRHCRVVKDFIAGLDFIPGRVRALGGMSVEGRVLINPKTTVTNKGLPDGYARSDSFCSLRNSEMDKIGVISALGSIGKVIGRKTMEQIAQALLEAHTPVEFSYEKKYRISQKEPVRNREEAVAQGGTKREEIPCPRCKEGVLTKRSRKSKKRGAQYSSSEFFGCSRYPKCRYTEEMTPDPS